MVGPVGRRGFEEPFAASTARGTQGASGALSVSAALALAKGALEDVSVRIVGEVSEVSVKPGYKAAYFTVKDAAASLPCMMWNNRYVASGVRLSVGSLVELTGRFSLYAAKGRMNFEVFSLALAGEGELRLRVANLARKLEAEGLMALSRKRALPAFPERIGLVTSPRGAAVHDVLRTLRRRFPEARVLVAGVPVEGTQAPAAIAEGIARACDAGAEVVLVVRGGGSFEDLMPFNDEGLARAIAACPVPVVTGIGHEPDTSIADMVADVRASTPTAAAEAVSPAGDALAAHLAARAQVLSTSMARTVERARAALAHRSARPMFEDGMYLLAAQALALDVAQGRLSRALPGCLARDAAALETAHARLARALSALGRDESLRVGRAGERLAASLPRAVASHRQQAQRLRDGLDRAMAAQIDALGNRVALGAARLGDLSPLGVIARGYSIARDERGAIVKSIESAPVGSALHVTVSNGVLACRVEDARRIETTDGSWED